MSYLAANTSDVSTMPIPAGTDLLFLTTTTQDWPKSNPATQTLIRRHVMQDIGKSRRSKKNRSKRYCDPQQQPWPIMQKETSSIGPRKASLPKGMTDLNMPTKDSAQQVSLLDDVSNRVSMSSQQSFYTLGSGSSDPFVCYPTKVNPETRRLISFMFDDSLGGNFGLYRNGWLPIGLTDAAAFQQVLSMFVVHLRALYGRGMGFPIVESLSYHTQAITSVRERLSNPAFVVTDGIIGAIIGFACHAHLTQEFEQWHVHMRALEQVIRVRGGLRSLHSNALLRLLLFFVDIIGSYAQDISPYFPIPSRLLPYVPTSTKSPISPAFQNFVTTLHDRYKSKGSELLVLFEDLDSITAYFSRENDRSAGKIWQDSILVQLRINPLIHRLLCAESVRHESSLDEKQKDYLIVSESCRLAALLYLATLRRRAGLLPVRTVCQLTKLKTKFENDCVDWTELQNLRLWALTLGAVEASAISDRTWFVDRIAIRMRDLGAVRRDQIDTSLQSLVKCDDIYENALRRLGRDVHQSLTAFDNPHDTCKK